MSLPVSTLQSYPEMPKDAVPPLEGADQDLPRRPGARSKAFLTGFAGSVHFRHTKQGKGLLEETSGQMPREESRLTTCMTAGGGSLTLQGRVATWSAFLGHSSRCSTSLCRSFATALVGRPAGTCPW